MNSEMGGGGWGKNTDDHCYFNGLYSKIWDSALHFPDFWKANNESACPKVFLQRKYTWMLLDFVYSIAFDVDIRLNWIIKYWIFNGWTLNPLHISRGHVEERWITAAHPG